MRAVEAEIKKKGLRSKPEASSFAWSYFRREGLTVDRPYTHHATTSS